MRKISFYLIIIFLLTHFVAAQKVNPYQPQIAAFEEFITKQMATDKVPGLSVGFIKDDFIWTKGFGYSDLENKILAKPESMYRLASVTKPMTATAILQLVEKGKINLDAEVQTYVPYFPKKNFPVTIRQLLGHLGGISHYQDNDKELHFKDYKNTRQSIAVFENFDLVAEPNTKFSYSSYGYNLLGAVIEAVSGQTYGDYMTENIWKPLGMKDTRMDSSSDLIPNRVRGYQLVNNQITNSEFVDVSSRFSAGGTRSTVVDLLRFGKGISDGKLLSKATYDSMFSSMTTKNGQQTYYGMGWSVFPTNGRFVLTHNGGQNETSTTLFVFPAKKLVIAVTANLERADVDSYAQHLFEILTGEDWNTNAYIANGRKNVPLYLAINAAYEEGRAYFERNQKSFSENQETVQAFELFNQTLNNETLEINPKSDIFQKIRLGRIIGGPFVKIGSYMAMKLLEKYGAERLEAYSNTGSISFFDDYIKLKDIPKEFRFNETVEKKIIAWQKSWSITNTAELRKQSFDSNTDFEAVGTKLKNSFANAEVYPNYANQINNLSRNLFLARNFAQALKAAQLGVDLYPDLENVNSTQGILLTLSGNKEKGKEFLKKAFSFNSQGEASPGGLNALANQLSGLGLVDAGLELLKVAVELYPNEAFLYNSLGDFYTKKGVKDKAIESYQKVLQINPNYPNAAKIKEILKELNGAN